MVYKTLDQTMAKATTFNVESMVDIEVFRTHHFAKYNVIVTKHGSVFIQFRPYTDDSVSVEIMNDTSTCVVQFLKKQRCVVMSNAEPFLGFREINIPSYVIDAISSRSAHCGDRLPLFTEFLILPEHIPIFKKEIGSDIHKKFLEDLKNKELCEKLSEEKTELLKTIADLKTELLTVTELQTKMGVLQIDKHISEEINAELLAECSKLKTTRQAASDACVKYAEKNAELLAECSRLRTKCKDLGNDNAKYVEHNNELRVKNFDNESQIRHLQAENAELRTKYQNLEVASKDKCTTCEENLTKIGFLHDIINGADKPMQKLNEDNLMLKHENEKLKVSQAKECKKYADQVESYILLNADADRLKFNLQASHEENERLCAEINRLKAITKEIANISKTNSN